MYVQGSKQQLSHRYEACYPGTSSGPKFIPTPRTMSISHRSLLHEEVLPKSFESIRACSTAEIVCWVVTGVRWLDSRKITADLITQTTSALPSMAHFVPSKRWRSRASSAQALAAKHASTAMFWPRRVAMDRQAMYRYVQGITGVAASQRTKVPQEAATNVVQDCFDLVVHRERLTSPRPKTSNKTPSTSQPSASAPPPRI